MANKAAIAHPQTVEEILATCPPEKRDRFEKRANRLANRPQMKTNAIKLKCLECCAWQSAEVRRCEIRGCALWALRP